MSEHIVTLARIQREYIRLVRQHIGTLHDEYRKSDSRLGPWIFEKLAQDAKGVAVSKRSLVLSSLQNRIECLRADQIRYWRNHAPRYKEVLKALPAQKVFCTPPTFMTASSLCPMSLFCDLVILLDPILDVRHPLTSSEYVAILSNALTLLDLSDLADPQDGLPSLLVFPELIGELRREITAFEKQTVLPYLMDLTGMKGVEHPFDWCRDIGSLDELAGRISRPDILPNVSHMPIMYTESETADSHAATIERAIALMYSVGIVGGGSPPEDMSYAYRRYGRAVAELMPVVCYARDELLQLSTCLSSSWRHNLVPRIEAEVWPLLKWQIGRHEPVNGYAFQQGGALASITGTLVENPDLTWLGRVPPDLVKRIRGSDDFLEIRGALVKLEARVKSCGIDDLASLSQQAARDVDTAFRRHEASIRRQDSKLKAAIGNDLASMIVTGGLGILATVLPTLGPASIALGLGLGGKSARDVYLAGKKRTNYHRHNQQRAMALLLANKFEDHDVRPSPSMSAFDAMIAQARWFRLTSK